MFMTPVEDVVFSESFKRDLDRAVTTLREAGCSEIFLFGSGAAGVLHEGSDIDLAVRGCPPGDFFRLLGKLILELDHPVDLVSLDRGDAFSQYLVRQGVLRRIG